MKDYISDIIRQTEILAAVMNGVTKSKLDFAEQYGVTEVTIQRDLENLRSYGLEIFSRGKRVRLLENPPQEPLIEILANYLPLKLNSDVFKKQVSVFSKQNKSDFFPNLALLSKAVNENTVIEIKYKRFYDNQIKNYSLIPIRLFANEYNWLLHAIKEGEKQIQTFYVTRIIELRLTGKHTEKIDLQQTDEQECEIVLKFSPEAESEILDKIWFEKFELIIDENGYLILKTKVPLTNKLASWCISWWDMLEIVEPIKLKDIIKEMIESFRKKNKL